MEWSWIDGWIVAAGVLCAVSCALLGNFLVLRKMSMMGDAISHAVLPGLAAAFLFSGSRASLTMFIGAAAVGVLTAILTQAIHRFGRVEEGASMGVVFTMLFAIGLIMIVRGADQVDLDPGCVLYGAIELIPLDRVEIGPLWIPRAVLGLGVITVINVLFVTLFYKELKLTSFDEQLATTMGISSSVMHYALMTLVAVTAVAAFESVGSILVIAMLIVPGATAYLFCDRLGVMIGVSLVVAILSAVLGHVAAVAVPMWFGYADTSTAGMMAVVSGVLFGLAFVGAPRYGLISRAAHRAAMQMRIAREDLLALMYRLEERHIDAALTESMAHHLLQHGPFMRRLILIRLKHSKLVEARAKAYRLTPEGRNTARRVVRSHRLWESFLHRYLKLRPDHVHGTAERLEHVTDAALQEELAEKVGSPTRDPHGESIPPQ